MVGNGGESEERNEAEGRGLDPNCATANEDL